MATNTNANSNTGVYLNYPTDYKFNLPPHNWSLITTSLQLDRVPGKNRVSLFNSASLSSNDRRGRIWRYGDTLSLQGGEFSSTAATNPADNKSSSKNKNASKSSATNAESLRNWRNAEKYGFQFLWNPTSYSTSTALSDNVIATGYDSYAGGNVFQGTGSISFEIHLNRINDFACFKSTNETDLSRYYGPISGKYGNKSDYLYLFKDLKERGTLADLEFLYKTVNGSEIQNLANKRTSDIGLLIPQLIRVDIGPYSQVGSITGLSVNHLMFTEDMIPIMSTVNISISVVSRYGYSSNLANDLSNSSGGDNKINPPAAPKLPVEKLRVLRKLKLMP